LCCETNLDSLSETGCPCDQDATTVGVEDPGAIEMVGAPMTLAFHPRSLLVAAALSIVFSSCESPDLLRSRASNEDLGPTDSDFATDVPESPDPLCEGRRVGAGPCNGSEQLCERRYDEVAYVTTHNAMSNAEEGWIAPNHRFGIRRQLDDGVRAMMIDTHYDEEDGGRVPSLCHGSCRFGAITLPNALADIEVFLRCNPQQLLTLIVEAYVSADDTEAAFDEAGLLPYVYTHAVGEEWPTLRAMIDRDQRLVVLSDDGGSPQWYMNLWEHVFETPFAAERSGDLVCEKNRGELSNSLFVLNHFLTAPLASASLAERVNTDPFMSDRVEECRQVFDRIPNFVTVDFYSIGDVFDATATLNRL
jgi:hypothetical protein